MRCCMNNNNNNRKKKHSKIEVIRDFCKTIPLKTFTLPTSRVFLCPLSVSTVCNWTDMKWEAEAKRWRRRRRWWETTQNNQKRCRPEWNGGDEAMVNTIQQRRQLLLCCATYDNTRSLFFVFVSLSSISALFVVIVGFCEYLHIVSSLGSLSLRDVANYYYSVMLHEMPYFERLGKQWSIFMPSFFEFFSHLSYICS